MQPLAIHIFGILQRIVAGMLLIAALLFNIAVVAQPVTDTLHAAADSSDITSGSGRSADPAIITTFEQFNMPLEMVISFTQLTPKGILLYHDEFQVTRDGVDGLEIMMIKVWYIDDHIIGYIIRTPLEKAGAPVNKCKIDIPVAWICRPATQGHEEHLAHSLAELRTDEAAYKCTGWHIQMPPPLPPEPQYRFQKAKKTKKQLKEENQAGDGTLQSEAKPKKGKNKKVGFEPR